MKITPPKLRDETRIDFVKETCQMVVVKKQDRLIISGPCEILFTDMQVGPSLDFEAKMFYQCHALNDDLFVSPSAFTAAQEQENQQYLLCVGLSGLSRIYQMTTIHF